MELAREVFAAAGLKPYDHVVRGGTDGSRLTELGLPTPNLFCGEHNAHGPLEWVAVQDMESAVTACAQLAELWEKKGYGRAARCKSPPGCARFAFPPAWAARLVTLRLETSMRTAAKTGCR